MKEAVAEWHAREAMRDPNIKGNLDLKPIHCYNPGLGPDLSNYTGTVYLEGPHYPAAHTWYASGEMKDGILVKVK